ncbi:head GIN domain-containing protein [Henriciella litoralis]|uniref:head GIN domain-containing protein n=1 Tax=Henriciella litoralis TaxID=568102 RepID=UPI00111BF638|nr:head GIN domain-containing protein [Henriciella litoralis]
MKLKSLLAATTTLAVFAAPAIAETQTYSVATFDEIDVSSGINVIFEIGDTQSVEVENDKGDFSDIVVDVDEGALVLKRPKKFKMGFGKRRTDYTVRVVATSLNGIEASSGASAEGSGLTGDVDVGVSSGASAAISDIRADELEVEASSGSDVELSGTCVEIDADASSGADLDASGVQCERLTADVSSGASIRAYASKSVNADASSGGSVRVSGGATDVTIDKSSGGSVTVN